MVRIAVLSAFVVALLGGAAQAATSYTAKGSDFSGQASFTTNKGKTRTVVPGQGFVTGEVITVSTGELVVTYSNGCKVTLKAGDTLKVDQASCKFVTVTEKTAGISWIPAVGAGVVAGTLIGYAIGNNSGSGTNYIYVPVSN